MIPGRREVTVFGNPVNLAKRIQEIPRTNPEWFAPRPGNSSQRPHDLVLISGDTLAQAGNDRQREALTQRLDWHHNEARRGISRHLAGQTDACVRRLGRAEGAARRDSAH